VGDAKQSELFSVLAAVLHLGQLQFGDGADDCAEFSPDADSLLAEEEEAGAEAAGGGGGGGGGAEAEAEWATATAMAAAEADSDAAEAEANATAGKGGGKAADEAAAGGADTDTPSLLTAARLLGRPPASLRGALLSRQMQAWSSGVQVC
jgi:hypothetical protein